MIRNIHSRIGWSVRIPILLDGGHHTYDGHHRLRHGSGLQITLVPDHSNTLTNGIFARPILSRKKLIHDDHRPISRPFSFLKRAPPYNWKADNIKVFQSDFDADRRR